MSSHITTITNSQIPVIIANSQVPVIQVKGFTTEELLTVDINAIGRQFISEAACRVTFKQVIQDLEAKRVFSDDLEGLGKKCVEYLDKVINEKGLVDSETEALCTEVKVKTATMIWKIKLLSKKRSSRNASPVTL